MEETRRFSPEWLVLPVVSGDQEVSSNAQSANGASARTLTIRWVGAGEDVGFRDWLWRHSEQGRAWQAFERGDTRYDTELDVATASFKRTVEEIEDAGWCFAERVDHAPIKRTTVNPQDDGGHEVIKTVERRATFYFTRAETARIAPAMEQAAQDRRAEEL